ncbi:MAG: flagellar biosynthesis anti-sigma factor FlgM [Hydrogenophaga sp.]|nr:flagellar biosynthesis anti-sigma factor FlgM [Hydrogenophaga sp.]
MKINNLPDKPAGAITGAGKPADRLAASHSQRGSEAQPDAGVTVSLSPASQTITASVAKAGGDVFNAQKVEAVKTAIANGTFSINAEAVADKLLSNARDMLGVAAK